MKIRLVVLLGSGLLLVGCSSGSSTPGTGNNAGGACEAGTARVQVGTDFNGTIVGGSFPDNCTEVCIWTPESPTPTSLTIGLSGPNLDLDLFVDPSLNVLTSTSSSGTAQWESNAYGTGSESVTIPAPQGRYYAQACSYDGSATGFVLSTSTS